MQLSKRELFKKIEQEIEDDQPTKRQVSRKGLKKYLSMEVAYLATFDSKHTTMRSSCITDIKLLGGRKILADHLWVNMHLDFKHGDEIKFKGIAGSYTDSNGVRKYRLAIIGKVEKV